MGITIPSHLSDDDLVAEVKHLACKERDAAAHLVAHLAELDARQLYRGAGCSSLYSYCREVLRLSEDAAYNRVKAAQMARRFPVVLDMLADGRVTLTTVRLLAPMLTADNHRNHLTAATGKSKREVEELVARLAPRPDVQPSIRKLPAPSTARVVAANAAPSGVEEEAGVASPQGAPEPTNGPAAGARPTVAPPSAAHRPIVAPLSPERYRLQCTVDKETENNLRRLQDLLRREIPDGDPGVIIARALSLLRKAVEKQKLAATPRPRPGRGSKPGTRYVPARVRRAVWRRDGGRCAFVANDGRRCAERSYIELHHGDKPFAKGGEQTVENMSLRCRSHNAYESELIFGPYDPSRVRETPERYASSSARGPVPERVGAGEASAHHRHSAPFCSG